jgi:hypothetical protein
MSESDEMPQVLSRLGDGPRDTQLGQSDPSLPQLIVPGEEEWRAPGLPPLIVPDAEQQRTPRVSRRKRPAASDEQLRLPRGGLVGLRKSGGLVFRTSEIIIYRDGRVTSTHSGAAGMPPTEAAWRLSDEELTEIAALAATADLAGVPELTRASPDMNIYEIAARHGRRQRTVEASAGALPETLAPLIGRLERLHPPE